MIQQIILQISFYQRTNVDFIVFRITFNTIVWTAPTHTGNKRHTLQSLFKNADFYEGSLDNIKKEVSRSFTRVFKNRRKGR